MFRRLLAAWHVLIGVRLTPLQMEAEWIEYKAIFDDMLTRYSAQLARHAKAEKKRIERLHSDLEGPAQRELPLGGDAKQLARAKARARGFTGPRLPTTQPALAARFAPMPNEREDDE